MALQQRPDGTLTYVTGSMGAGKTTHVKGKVRKSRRLLVWDGKGIDWGARDGCTIITSLAELRRIATSKGNGRWSVRVTVNKANFAAFCKLAWIWLRIKPGDVVVDEIADVTSTAKAPQEWGEIARKSRAFGGNVFVTTQRPQECDKTAQGNAMLFHCGLMSDADDQAYVAKRLLGGMVPPADVASLGPLEYWERDVRTRTVRRGKVEFPRAFTVPVPAAKALPSPAVAAEVAPVAAPRGLLDW